MRRGVILAAACAAALATLAAVQVASARTSDGGGGGGQFEQARFGIGLRAEIRTQPDQSTSSTVQFDNTHLMRATTRTFPSDLELMPNLRNFLKDNGTLLNKHYNDSHLRTPQAGSSAR